MKKYFIFLPLIPACNRLATFNLGALKDECSKTAILDTKHRNTLLSLQELSTLSITNTWCRDKSVKLDELIIDSFKLFEEKFQNSSLPQTYNFKVKFLKNLISHIINLKRIELYPTRIMALYSNQGLADVIRKEISIAEYQETYHSLDKRIRRLINERMNPQTCREIYEAVDQRIHAYISRAITKAIYKNHLALRDALLGYARDVNLKVIDNNALLQLGAGHNNDVRFIKDLLEAGADIEAKTEGGRTPLHLAAMNNNENAITTLLRAGADIEAKTEYGETSLNLAARCNCVEAITTLLNAGADIEEKTEYEETSLNLAAGYNWVNAIRTLLSAGADIQAKNKYGDTALHIVISKNDPNTAEILLTAGADIEARNQDGNTPLHLAAGLYNNGQIVTAFLTAGAGIEARNQDGHIKNPIDVLLNAGADIQARNQDGRTPLHLAARYTDPTNGDVNPIDLLLNARADIQARDQDGNTPLHLAVRYTYLTDDHLNAIELLLNAGANVNARNKNGHIPFDIPDKTFNSNISEKIKLIKY